MASKQATIVFRIFGLAPTGLKADKYFVALPFFLGCWNVYINCSSTIKIQTLFALLNIIYTIGFIEFLLLNYFCSENFCSIEKELTKIEKKLDRVGALVRPSKSVWLTWLMSLTMVVPIIVGFYSRLTINLNTLSWGICNYVLCTMPLVQHMTLVNSVEAMFTALNDHLNNIALSADKTLLSIVRSRLDNVFHIHSSLHVVVDEINSIYWFYHLAIFGGKVVAFVSWMLHILDDSASYGNAYWLIVFGDNVVIVLLSALICDFCSEQGNKTRLIAHSALQADTHPALWEDVGQFSRLNVNNKVEFGVPGVFNLNLSFISKMAAAVFTYTNIALQLQDVQLFRANGTEELSVENNSSR